MSVLIEKERAEELRSLYKNIAYVEGALDCSIQFVPDMDGLEGEVQIVFPDTEGNWEETPFWYPTVEEANEFFSDVVALIRHARHQQRIG